VTKMPLTIEFVQHCTVYETLLTQVPQDTGPLCTEWSV